MTEFDECQQQIDAHGNPDLSHHGIFAGAQKRFDLEVLLDPFKKQLYLPALFINGSNGSRGQLEVVGDIFPLCLRVLVDHLAHVGQILLARAVRIEANDCITDDARMNRNATSFNNFISGVAPLAGDVKDPSPVSNLYQE